MRNIYFALRHRQVAENDGNKTKAHEPGKHHIECGYTAKLHQQFTSGKIQYTKTYSGRYIGNKGGNGNTFNAGMKRLLFMVMFF
ncbi:hypothetical protein D9M68_669040 [compost metagenome]